MVAVVAVVAEEVVNTTMRGKDEEEEVAVEAVAAEMAYPTVSILKMKAMQSKIINEAGAEVEEVVQVNSSNSMIKEDRITHAITKEEKTTIKEINVSISNRRSVIEWLMTPTRIN